MNSKKSSSSWVIVLLLLLPAACTTVPVGTESGMSSQLIQREQQILSKIVSSKPRLQAIIEQSAGYMTGVVHSGTTELGDGTHVGVIYDKSNQSRTYIRLKHADSAAELGSEQYGFLVIFESRESLLEFAGGIWEPKLVFDTTTTGKNKISTNNRNQGFATYVLAETGGAISLSLQMLKISADIEQPSSGLSNTSIPMTDLDNVEKNAPRQWQHKLPFLAQEVLDEGYDLPLPYGVSLVYAYVEQNQLLSSLDVGINGRDIVPFEFVAFKNAKSTSPSWQLRYDTWVFPFMNISAMVGTINGDAPLDVLLDGNLMLDHLETDCSKIVSRPLCNALEDKIVTLPVDAEFSGTSYSLGMLLAGGWKNYFVAIPFNWTHADMDETDARGMVLTITPRVGKTIDLGSSGSLALFIGGSYIDSELTVTGRVALENELLVIDYIVDQENIDKWNGVIGGNWDINRNWSIAFEYNGFFGSRDAYVASLTWRY